MTIKFEDLNNLLIDMRKAGYANEVSLNRMLYFIARRFGISDYIRKSVLKALVDYNFIREVGVGIFRIVDEKQELLEKQKELEKTENLIEKIEDDANGAVGSNSKD